MDKVINKTKLDELLEIMREYLKGEYEDVNEKCMEIIAFENKHFPNATRIVDFVVCNIAYGGMKPDASNEDIYKVLEVLGWEVKE